MAKDLTLEQKKEYWNKVKMDNFKASTELEYREKRMSNLGEMTEEMKQAAQQAKKDKIAYAKEHLDLDWGDDEKHWKSLSKRFGFRLPVYYQPNTEVKYIKRLFKKVGVDIQLYLADCGVTTLKRLNAMNPREPAFVSVGFAMEWLDEYFEENK